MYNVNDDAEINLVHNNIFIVIIECITMLQFTSKKCNINLLIAKM